MRVESDYGDRLEGERPAAVRLVVDRILALQMESIAEERRLDDAGLGNTHERARAALVTALWLHAWQGLMSRLEEAPAWAPALDAIAASRAAEQLLANRPQISDPDD